MDSTDDKKDQEIPVEKNSSLKGPFRLAESDCIRNSLTDSRFFFSSFFVLGSVFVSFLLLCFCFVLFLFVFVCFLS